MRKSMMVLLTVAVSVLVGCSSYDVVSDYDSAAPFATFKTYRWAIDPANAQGNLLLQNQLVGKRVKSAVDEELKAKGFTLVTSGESDIFVASHLTTKDKLNVTDWGYGYGAGPYRYGYGYGGSSVSVTQYTEGTLVVDMVNAKTKELVWRGIASGAMASQLPPPEEMEARIKEIIGAILAEYPPQP